MFIQPDWPAPPNIKAYHTLRTGGVSLPPFNSFNLGTHTGDELSHVIENRALLQQKLQLPTEPIWLTQIHGTSAVPALNENMEIEADAAFSMQIAQVCAVLTADCLPLFLCNLSGTHVAAIHAGWRGLAQGIIEQTISALNLPSNEILAWLGPAIGPQQFEVGGEVREIFLSKDRHAAQAFIPAKEKWLANLYLLATLRLEACGVTAIYGGQYCTYTQDTLFYSYRRDLGKTGRMASLIWRSS